MSSARARSSQPPRFVAGVDGGGSGTRVRLQSFSGELVGQGHGGPSALAQGVAQAWIHIGQAIDDAFQAARIARTADHHIALGLGLSGVESIAHREAFLAADPGFARCVLASDSLTTLQGAFGDRAGIVIAAGTGSVGTARWRDGSVHHAGGWGFPEGDEGSGAWLGLLAMQVAQRALDGRADDGPLARAVWRVAGADAVTLVQWCETAGQRAYAALAPLVFEAARQGDAGAAALLDAAARELAALVPPLDDPAGDEPLPIVLTGGIGARLRARWSAALRARLIDAEGDSTDGALSLVRAALAADGWVP